MLNPSQISDLKTKDPDSFNLFRAITDAINNFGLLMGVDPKPASHVAPADALPAPRAPKSISITVVSLVVFVILEASPDATDSAFYFVERSTSASFNQVTRYALGHGLQLAVPELPGTKKLPAITFWRCFAKYQMSGRSPFTVWEG